MEKKKENKKIINKIEISKKIFIILIVCALLFTFTFYKIGYRQGLIYGTFYAFQDESMCEDGKHTNWFNGTCYMGNYTKNCYQLNSKLILSGNQSMLREKIDLFMIIGVWLEDIPCIQRLGE